MKTILLILAITASLFSMCNKKGNESESCIENYINAIKEEPVRDPPASVWQYTYNGQTVYYIPPYCCDMFSELLDVNCNILCHPDGGFTGDGDGGCPDFFTNRTDEKLLWQDDRQYN